MNTAWPLSKILLMEVLADRIDDRFVEALVWARLGYQQQNPSSNLWVAGPDTQLYWSEKFPEAPQIITQRSASVHLTRSIPKQYKQSLKKHLNFEGYQIGDLYPRRTRRATAVNWLLSWALQNEQVLPDEGPLPPLLLPPDDPSKPHFDDF